MRGHMSSLVSEVALRRGMLRLRGHTSNQLSRVSQVFLKRDCKAARRVDVSTCSYTIVCGRLRRCVHAGAHLKVPLLASTRNVRNVVRGGYALFPRTLTRKDAFGPRLVRRVARTTNRRTGTVNVRRVLSPIFSVTHRLH